MGSVVFFRTSTGIMESEPKTFGDWLREKRIAAHLSLQDVATRAGVSKQRLSAIENNQRRTKKGQLPRLREDKVEAIAEAIFVPIEEARLAAGLSSRRATEHDLQQGRLLAYFNELPADQQAAALAMIEALWRQQHTRQRAEKQDAKAKKKRAG